MGWPEQWTKSDTGAIWHRSADGWRWALVQDRRDRFRSGWRWVLIRLSPVNHRQLDTWDSPPGGRGWGPQTAQEWADRVIAARKAHDSLRRKRQRSTAYGVVVGGPHAGETFWGGAIDRRTGRIDALVHWDHAQQWDFHLDYLFDDAVADKVRQGSSAFFFVDLASSNLSLVDVGGALPADWNVLYPRLLDQVAVVKLRNPRGRKNRRAPAAGLWRLDASGSTSGGNRSTVGRPRPVYALRYYYPGSALKGFLSKRRYVDFITTSAIRVRWLAVFAQVANELGLKPEQISEDQVRAAAKLGWKASRTSEPDERRMAALADVYRQQFAPERLEEPETDTPCGECEEGCPDCDELLDRAELTWDEWEAQRARRQAPGLRIVR